MSIQQVNHKTSETIYVNGLEIIEHRFQLPLNHDQADGRKIEVFAREVGIPGSNKNAPWMIYFNGGPGCESPRPTGKSGWIGEALKDHRLLLLDQRGTGLSSRVCPQTLAKEGLAAEQAEYLSHFRADNIVRDSEAIRQTLLGKENKWVGAGQSYGGFCLLTYLSLHPEGLSGVIITGGVACIKQNIKDNYRLTYKQVLAKNKLYYQRYPQDIAKVQEIVKFIKENTVMLPSGVQLTARRFQQLGMAFGGSGGLESLHYLIEAAFIDGVHGKELSYAFLQDVQNSSGFERNPIFCILHESIYAEAYATQWAAEQLRDEFPEVDTSADTFYFTGEMISPCMLDSYKELQPLKEVAELIAQKSDWGKLYDLDQLANNTVPVSAISYYDDMYVPVEWSEETAQHTGNFRIWVTNEWEHNGIRDAGAKIYRTLLDRLKEPAPYGLR